MLRGGLRIGGIVRVGIVVIEDAEVGAGFSPEVLGFGGMDVRIVSAGRGQNVVIGGGVGDVVADVHEAGRRCRLTAVPFTRLLMNGAFGF